MTWVMSETWDFNRAVPSAPTCFSIRRMETSSRLPVATTGRQYGFHAAALQTELAMALVSSPLGLVQTGSEPRDRAQNLRVQQLTSHHHKRNLHGT